MNICGILVFANPAKTETVTASLRAMAGVEVHVSAEDDGRIVVTVEDTPQVSALDSLTLIHKLEGVVSASLVYHNFESAQPAAVHK